MAARKGNRFASRERRELAPLERFLSFCQFDATTGCVIWTGGQTSGRGHSAPYGSFWFGGRRWFAHRWAAKHIHGHAIDGLQVEHFCPHRPHPNTLCVEHVHPLTLGFNRELQTLRSRPQTQDVAERMYWIYVQVGLSLPPPVDLDVSDDVPFYTAPPWLREKAADDCPF
jgi:hypothetical protein